MIREYQKLEELQKKIMEMFPSVEPDDVDQEQPTNRKKPILSDDQIRALTLASHCKLQRGRCSNRLPFTHRRKEIRPTHDSSWRSGWYAEMPGLHFFAKRPAIRAITVRKLWQKAYLTGVPDAVLLGSKNRNTTDVHLVASEAGKAVLEQIKAEKGIYFDLDTSKMVYPKRRSRKDVKSDEL